MKSGAGEFDDAHHADLKPPPKGRRTVLDMEAGLERPPIDSEGCAMVVAFARREAVRLLAPCGTRLAHVAGAARAAISVSCTVDDDDVGLLVAAAWLHDIGYAPEIARTGFHPLDGARYLGSIGHDERLCQLVANHTGAWAEADARGLGDVLASEFPAEHSAAADALTYADLTTGPRGQPMTVEARLAEILTRYAPGHVVHQSIGRAQPNLLATVRRVEQRLAEVLPHPQPSPVAGGCWAKRKPSTTT